MHHGTPNPGISLPPIDLLPPALHGLWRRALRAWTEAGERRQRRAHDRLALAELHDMSERELQDIGISRSDLPGLAQRDSHLRYLQELAAWPAAAGAGSRRQDTSATAV